jgi:anaerobic magnesium-protoporphyrin IX monomethyl ester cyclase
MTDRLLGDFTASVFEYRPYPGTPDWHRLMATGRYTTAQLLDYSAVDLTDNGADTTMLQRDEFNFSIDLQLSDAPIPYLHAALIRLMRAQHERDTAA